MVLGHCKHTFCLPLTFLSSMFDRELFACSLSALHDAFLRLRLFAMASAPPGLPSAPPSFSVRFAVTAIAGVAVAAAVGGSLLYRHRSRHKRRKKKRFPLTQKQWQDAFDAENGRLLGYYELLKKIRFGGIEPSIRAEVWPFLLGFHNWKSTWADREIEKSHKRKEYEDLRRQCNRLREKSYEEFFEDETGSEVSNSASEQVQKEAERDFTATLWTATDNAASGLGSSRQDTKVDCNEEPLSKVQDASINNSCLNGEEDVTICGKGSEDCTYSGLDNSRGNAEGNCKEELLDNASVNDCYLHNRDGVKTCGNAQEDAPALERENSREDTGVDCNKEPLNKDRNAVCCTEVWEDSITQVNGTEGDTSSGLDSSRGNTQGDYIKEPLNNIQNASIKESSMNAADAVSTSVIAMEDNFTSGLDNDKENREKYNNEEPLSKGQDASIADSHHEGKGIDCKEEPLNKDQDAVGCMEAWEDVLPDVNGTEDDISSGLDSSRENTEGDYEKVPLSNIWNAGMEDSSINAADVVSSSAGTAMKDDGTLGLNSSKENTEEAHNEEPLNKVQDASIADSCHEAGEDVITCVKDREVDATSDLDSNVNIEGVCKEKHLNKIEDANIEDSCLKVTEDVINWQRIIRLDAVRMNAEWVPYSPTQACVTGMVAQELATSVGLKDDEHLEPCRQHHAARLVAILEAYALYDPETGYCQGMSDLLSPFVALLDDDYEAFWCFAQFMNTTRYNFRKDEIGIRRQLDLVCRILKECDPHLYRHLQIMDAQDCFFVYRMVLVLMRRELSFEQTISLWEVLWAEIKAVEIGDARFSQRKVRRKALPTDDLLLYVIAAAVWQRRDVIIQSCSGMDEILRECNSMAGNLDVWALLDDARDLVFAVHGRILD